MTTRTIVQLTIFLVAGLLLGLLIGQTSIFGIFKLTAVTGPMCLIFIILLVVDLLTKKKNSEGKYIIGLISLTLIVSVLTSLVTMNVIADNNQKLAEDLVPKIESYKQTNSQYPKTLSDLQSTNPLTLIN